MSTSIASYLTIKIITIFLLSHHTETHIMYCTIMNLVQTTCMVAGSSFVLKCTTQLGRTNGNFYTQTWNSIYVFCQCIIMLNGIAILNVGVLTNWPIYRSWLGVVRVKSVIQFNIASATQIMQILNILLVDNFHRHATNKNVITTTQCVL